MGRAAFALFFCPLTLVAQTYGNAAPGVINQKSLPEQVSCGPIGIQARMVDASGLPAKPSQMVRITLINEKSVAIVLERITVHFGSETPTSGAPFEIEAKVEVGARQEAFLAEAFSDPNPVLDIELSSARYADGSSWLPRDDEVCKIVPDPLKN